MAFQFFERLRQINRPSSADIRRRTYRVTNRIGLKSWTAPIFLAAIKPLWSEGQSVSEGGESEQLPPFPDRISNSARYFLDSACIYAYLYLWEQDYVYLRRSISYFDNDQAWSRSLRWLASATNLNSNLRRLNITTNTSTPQAEMNNSTIGPVVMLIMMLNQYIDAITHGILNILYSLTSSIPLLNTILWPISIFLRLRIHLAPQKSLLGVLLAPLKLGGCENVTGAVVAGAGVWWLYGNCRPFRRVVVNIKRRARRAWAALKRLDFVGVVKGVIMDPDAPVGKTSSGFRIQVKR
ncbi:hypothetical protein TWF506_011460 [Arthrobotrys conoides]|uniref:Uncharacterized protein n=1 Tax=Arthrobotrys conoides TaxID=74498 RepID=A0AAN8RVM4_9PEZI